MYIIGRGRDERGRRKKLGGGGGRGEKGREGGM